MTLCFLGILRNHALYAYPQLLDVVISKLVIAAAILCCIAWGIVDGIFYALENHSLATRKNLIAEYVKTTTQRDDGLAMVAEDLQDSYVDILDDNQKQVIYEEVLDKLSKAESKEKVPIKDDTITIFLGFCLNLGACLVVILPFLLLQNILGIRLSVYISIVVAIFLLFIIGVWTQTSKSLRLKFRRGLIYAVLGIVITILTLILGG